MDPAAASDSCREIAHGRSSTCGVEHVARDFEEDRTGPAVVGLAKGHADQFGNALGVETVAANFVIGRMSADVVQLLQPAHVQLRAALPGRRSAASATGRGRRWRRR